MLEKLPDVIGHALRGRRAGVDKLAFNRIDLRQGMGALTVGSLAFIDHAPIPEMYTADGEGISPPLHWSGVPADAASLVLIVEDADAPTPEPLVHAIVVDLRAEDGALPEAGIEDISVTPEEEGGEAPRVGRNSFLKAGWLPPDPPPGHGQHRYAFQLFALAADHKPFSQTPGRDELLENLAASAVASGLLIGTYERPDGSVKEPGTAAETSPVAAVLPTPV